MRSIAAQLEKFRKLGQLTDLIASQKGCFWRLGVIWGAAAFIIVWFAPVLALGVSF